MLKVDDTAFVLIDYQGKLARVMHQSEELQANMIRLVKGMQLLNIPIIWLEQYPKGLGPTAQDIKELLDGAHQPIAKMNFSACQSTEFQSTVEKLDRDNFLVAGIEAHICVYQTVYELLNMGRYVEFVTDGIASRAIENKHIAIEKMRALGALPTSIEMALFELMGTAEHPRFKEISKLIK